MSPRRAYTRDSILWIIDHARTEKGKPLTSRDADKGSYGLPAVATIRTYCGSWRQACLDAVGEADNRGGSRYDQAAPTAQTTMR